MVRQAARKASRASGSTPAFCGSRPVLTWTKSVGQAPRACTAWLSLRARLSRSRLWMASKSSSARASLFDCSGPTRWSAGAGEAGAERGPAAFGLLHAVLAEDALAGREHRLDAVEGLQLGDGDEGDRVRRAAGAGESGGDAGADVG